MDSKTINFEKFILLFKDKKIINILKFYVLAQEAKIKSIWAPHLTPYIGKDKVTEFCNDFNKESALLYKKDVLIPIYFILYNNKTYNFILRTPTFFYLLKILFDFDKLFRFKKKTIYYITIEELWYFLIIKNSSYILFSEKKLLIIFIKLLKSFGIKIII